MDIFQISGIIGLLLISTGVLLKKRKEQDILYIIGGILLGIYSFRIGEIIFIVLQIVFVLAATDDLIRRRK